MQVIKNQSITCLNACNNKNQCEQNFYVHTCMWVCTYVYRWHSEFNWLSLIHELRSELSLHTC